MARKYQVGDRVILTRSVSVKHFSSVGMSITGEIVEIRENGQRERKPPSEPRNYGIKFDDRAGVWWYAGWEFRRARK